MASRHKSSHQNICNFFFHNGPNWQKCERNETLWCIEFFSKRMEWFLSLVAFIHNFFSTLYFRFTLFCVKCLKEILMIRSKTCCKTSHTFRNTQRISRQEIFAIVEKILENTRPSTSQFPTPQLYQPQPIQQVQQSQP